MSGNTVITTCLGSSIGHAVHLDCAFVDPLFLLSCRRIEVYVCELCTVVCQSLSDTYVSTYFLISYGVFRMVMLYVCLNHTSSPLC